MLDTIFSYKKHSYPFSDRERLLTLILLDFIKYELKDGNGSYLDTIDLNKINFTWCANMVLNDDGTIGSWVWVKPNSVFIKPNDDSEGLHEFLKTEKLNQKEKSLADEIIQSHPHINPFKNISISIDEFNFIEYMLSMEVLVTIMHELYHRFQWDSSKIGYIFNDFVFKLCGYELSTKIHASIEGDVRVYVDNDDTRKKVKDLGTAFHSLVYLKNRLSKKDIGQEEFEMMNSQLEEIKGNLR